MEIAFFEAKKAAAVGEVPIGVVIRDDLNDTILVSTHNKVEQLLDQKSCKFQNMMMAGKYSQWYILSIWAAVGVLFIFVFLLLRFVSYRCCLGRR